MKKGLKLNAVQLQASSKLPVITVKPAFNTSSFEFCEACSVCRCLLYSSMCSVVAPGVDPFKFYV